jgi:hypothetical protein
MAFTQEDELKVRFDIVKSFGETVKSYIQISSAALALPLVFTQAIFGKAAAERGLRSVGVPYTIYGAWTCFLVAIACGLLYQWLSVRRVWDGLHDMQRRAQNVGRPGFRRTWWVIHFEQFNLSMVYGGMVFFFFWGAALFVIFSITVIKTLVEP